LALHRKSMEETSALKPLEYLMYGLPIILGYRETEDGINKAPFTLYIGNHDNNVCDNITQISAFSKEWCRKRVSTDLSFISAPTIEQRRINFMSQFVRG